MLTFYVERIVDYELRIIDSSDHLHIDLSGVLISREAKQMVHDVLQPLLATHHRRLLLDVRTLDLKSSTSDDFWQAAYAANQLTTSKHKIALLSSEAYLKANRFFETVGVNRGMHIRTFTDEQDARNWLMDS
jgi:hypothetical protein